MLKHGMKYLATYDGVEFECMAVLDGFQERWFLLHNRYDMDGDHTQLKREYGYKYSWTVWAGDDLGLKGHSISHIRPLVKISTKQRLLSNRLKAILIKMDDNNVARELIIRDIHKVVKKIRNIDMRANEGLLSYLPEGKQCVLSENGKWTRQNRQVSKPGKLVNKIFKDKFSQKEIEVFQNRLKSLNTTPTFVEVEGEDIRKYYHEDKHHRDVNIGTLSVSCMRYDNCSDFFDLYTKNAGYVKLLVLIKGGKVIGRALIWNMGDNWFMDRVYGSDVTRNVFRDHAKEKGYWYKYFDNHNSWKEMIIDSERVSQNQKLKIDCKTKDDNGEPFHKYPYMDTLMYINQSSVSNYKIQGDSFAKARSQSGEYEDLTLTECEHCGVRIRDPITVDGYDYCPSCVIIDCVSGDYIKRTLAALLHDGRWTLIRNTVQIYRDHDSQPKTYLKSEAPKHFMCSYYNVNFLDTKENKMYLRKVGKYVYRKRAEEYMKSVGYKKINGKWTYFSDDLFKAC